jgi:hypothetical protein
MVAHQRPTQKQITRARPRPDLRPFLSFTWIANNVTKQVMSAAFGFSSPSDGIASLVTYGAAQPSLTGYLEVSWTKSIPDDSWKAFVCFTVRIDSSNEEICGIEVPVSIRS